MGEVKEEKVDVFYNGVDLRKMGEVVDRVGVLV